MVATSNSKMKNSKHNDLPNLSSSSCRPKHKPYCNMSFSKLDFLSIFPESSTGG